MVVVDATVVVAALVDTGPDGRWADAVLSSGSLAAPHLMPAEVANILRRLAAAGEIADAAASAACEDLMDLRVELFPWLPFARRVWSLRQNVTAYDAWYAALAEELDAPLATLDLRLARSSGPTCRFRVPESGWRPRGR